MKRFKRVEFTFQKSTKWTVLAPDDLTPEHAERIAQAFASEELDYIEDTPWEIKVGLETIQLAARDRLNPTELPYYVLNDRFTSFGPAVYADWWRSNEEEVQSEAPAATDTHQLFLFEKSQSVEEK